MSFYCLSVLFLFVMYFSCPLLYGSKATIQLYSFFPIKSPKKNQVKQNQIYTITLYGDDDNIGIVLLYWIWERTYGRILCFGFMIYVYSIHIKLRNDLHCPVSSLPKKRSTRNSKRFKKAEIYLYLLFSLPFHIFLQDAKENVLYPLHLHFDKPTWQVKVDNPKKDTYTKAKNLLNVWKELLDEWYFS